MGARTRLPSENLFDQWKAAELCNQGLGGPDGGNHHNGVVFTCRRLEWTGYAEDTIHRVLDGRGDAPRHVSVAHKSQGDLAARDIRGR